MNATPDQLRHILRGYIDRIRARATLGDGDALERRICEASTEELPDLILLACIGAHCTAAGDDIAAGYRFEASRLAHYPLNPLDHARMVPIAVRLRELADREPYMTGAGRPEGAASTPAGWALKAIEDAHVGLGRDAALDWLLAAGAPGQSGCRGAPSPGRDALLRFLEPVADVAGIPKLKKAANNTRQKRERKKSGVNK